MKTFHEWLIDENVLMFPIEMKWMSMSLQNLKKYLMQAIDMLSTNGTNAHTIEFKLTLKELIPQMQQKHGMALRNELDMLSALAEDE